MKSIYDEDNRYSDDAQDLDSKANAAMRPLFEEFLAKGYTPREVGQVIDHAVHSEMYLQILEFRRGK